MGYGQYLHQKPINRTLGAIRIVLGCEGDINVIGSDDLAISAEVSNLDQFINNVIYEIKTLLPSDSARNVFDMEQRFWIQERSKYCKILSRSTPSDVPKMVEIECRKWATTCRLEELLESYDAIRASER